MAHILRFSPVEDGRPRGWCTPAPQRHAFSSLLVSVSLRN
ncbi:hypothetical protein T4D_9874 [Trichinella pseudospiralis]|uniref:Uncharacterized protein n=1 Tax=Trichinella pseudospiralis TaxID=6337 RepID=A0A0V1D0P8_TRIPS|nr:hypothetical protein T4D_9874 [Trichinella pseudospiralis]